MSQVAKNASAMPYKATLDAQGRLTALSYTVETASGDMVTEIALTDLGKPLTIKAPAAAQVGEAADSAYTRF